MALLDLYSVQPAQPYMVALDTLNVLLNLYDFFCFSQLVWYQFYNPYSIGKSIIS